MEKYKRIGRYYHSIGDLKKVEFVKLTVELKERKEISIFWNKSWPLAWIEIDDEDPKCCCKLIYNGMHMLRVKMPADDLVKLLEK